MPNPSGAVDLGSGHYYFNIVDADNNRIGIIENHPDKRDPARIARCEGFVCWSAAHARPGKLWQLINENPLTLKPSIKCDTCGCHGYITDGHWIE